MDEFRREILKEHNKARTKFGCVPHLALDDNLNQKAQFYANHLANEDTGLVHSSNRSLGENLFQFYSSDLKLCSAQLVVESFVNESKYYNFDNPKLTNVYSAGHFTQVVWKNSSLLGRINCFLIFFRNLFK
jgi:uncharacterized protein YkwD